jgi:putative transposase
MGLRKPSLHHADLVPPGQRLDVTGGNAEAVAISKALAISTLGYPEAVRTCGWVGTEAPADRSDGVRVLCPGIFRPSVIRVRPKLRADNKANEIRGRADHRHLGGAWSTDAVNGAKCADLCRKHGMSEGAFYTWKATFGGMTVSQTKWLKTREDENGRLKKLLAKQMLNLAAMNELVPK